MQLVRVEVQLFATLAAYVPDDQPAGSATIEVPDGTTVIDLVRCLGIPASMPRMALVNGEDADDERPLAPGDVVALFPPLAGGGGRQSRSLAWARRSSLGLEPPQAGPR